MSEAASALGGATFGGLVRIEEIGPLGMITLRGDLGAAKLKRAVRTVAGVEVPGPRGAAVADATGALWMSPDELLILVPHDEAAAAAEKLAKALSGTHHLVAEVSDARAAFRISGEDWRDVLAKLTPADLHPSAFGPGELRRTRLAQVPAAFWMVDEATVELVCFRSVARYVFDILTAAADSGASVDHY